MLVGGLGVFRALPSCDSPFRGKREAPSGRAAGQYSIISKRKNKKNITLYNIIGHIIIIIIAIIMIIVLQAKSAWSAVPSSGGTRKARPGRKSTWWHVLLFCMYEILNCLHFSSCACHACAGAMLILYVSFQY